MGWKEGDALYFSLDEMLVHCKTSSYDLAVDLPSSHAASFQAFKDNLFQWCIQDEWPQGHTFCPGPRVPKTIDRGKILRLWNKASNWQHLTTHHPPPPISCGKGSNLMVSVHLWCSIEWYKSEPWLETLCSNVGNTLDIKAVINFIALISTPITN